MKLKSLFKHQVVTSVIAELSFSFSLGLLQMLMTIMMSEIKISRRSVQFVILEKVSAPPAMKPKEDNYDWIQGVVIIYQNFSYLLMSFCYW